MGDTKEHILNIAFKLFLQKNFKEVTMKEIVKKTGLSTGAFYHYFTSKEKLLEEVIDNFFSSMHPAYDKYSKNSLYEFYHICAKESNVLREKNIENNEDKNDSSFTANFYFLLFDAMNLIPGFRKKIEDHQEKERNAWIAVIKHAKESGEIKTTLTDKHIASFFISTGDGISLNLVLGGKYETIKNEIMGLWNAFYKSIKI
jgi:TetR/AcrR family transcriptional repressor of nem operon